MKPRKEVLWFAREMEAKLRENDHKDGWIGCRFDVLYYRLREETDELVAKACETPHLCDDSISTEDACDLIRECADIANFAMMIADNIRLKREHSTKSP